jgi:cobalt/nickel transport system permease protein
MHVPDHFMNDPVSASTAAIAVAGVAFAALNARRDTRTPLGSRPLAFAATTALVFGLQMLNYPVASGTSGHLLGGALAAALLGPAWGVLSITVVLAVQSLAFADGGLTALGTNVMLMALVGTCVGWFVQRFVARRFADDGVARLGLSAAAGALVSVPAAALLFTGLFLVGGTVPAAAGALTGQMLGVHALIGLGDAVITGALVAAVAAFAPGTLALDTREARPVAAPRALALTGGFALVAAGLLSPFASGSPDGLEATAERVGFAGAARDHMFASMPLADYGEAGGLSVQLVGIIGLAVCAAAALAIAAALRLRRPAQAAA